MDVSSPKSSRLHENFSQTGNAPMPSESDPSTIEEWATNEFGIPITGWEGRLLDIPEVDLKNAIEFPLAGWSRYRDLYGTPQPECV